MQETLVSRATDQNGAEWARVIREGIDIPRKAGDKPGTYTIGCPRCQQQGILRNSCGIEEPCPTCDGARRITLLGQRHRDRELRDTPSVADVLFFTAAAGVVTVILVGIALWSGAL